MKNFWLHPATHELGDFFVRRPEMHAPGKGIHRARRNPTEGTSDAWRNSLRIKAKTVFNTSRWLPVINVMAYHFPLLSNFEPKPATSGQDLKSYTIQNRSKTRSAGNSRPHKAFDPEDFAHF
jgi:hypothetical protein